MGPILVIEDDVDTRDVLTHTLRDAGFYVLASDEGRKAIELATALRPSVVVLDLAMEGMDGWTFLRRRRAIPALAAVPVVVVTGSDDAGIEADAVLRKPVGIEDVLATVRRLHLSPS